VEAALDTLMFAGPGGKAPATNRPVKVFILLGQSNMLGMGRIGSQGRGGPEGSLENAVKEKKNLAMQLTLVLFGQFLLL